MGAAMRRRQFLAMIGGATAAWPLPVRAQQSGRTIKIGALVLTRGDVDAFGSVLRAGLQEFGYREGQNTAIDIRSADGNAAVLPALAADLVRKKVDVIVTVFTPCAIAAKQATSEIPIVAAVVGDPVGTGLVASLARPGGNVTGLSQLGPETAGKCVELLRDLIPSLQSIGVLVNPVDPFTKPFLDHIQRTGRSNGIEIKPIMARGADEGESAFAAFAKDRVGAVILQAGFFPNANLAIRHRLPSASILRPFTIAGGLMSYGADIPDLFRRSTILIHKILQGAKPADLPVEQPTKFHLAINLKTARTIGLAIPETFLLRADEVIE